MMLSINPRSHDCRRTCRFDDTTSLREFIFDVPDGVAHFVVATASRTAEAMAREGTARAQHQADKTAMDAERVHRGAQRGVQNLILGGPKMNGGSGQRLRRI
jgi:hypothetical protein